MGCSSLKLLTLFTESSRSTPAESTISLRADNAISRIWRTHRPASAAALGSRSGPKINSPITARATNSPMPMSNISADVFRATKNEIDGLGFPASQVGDAHGVSRGEVPDRHDEFRRVGCLSSSESRDDVAAA